MARRVSQSLVSCLAIGVSLAAPIEEDIQPRRNFIAEAGLTVTENYHPLIRVPLTRSSLLDPLYPDPQDGLASRQPGLGTDYIKAIPLQTEYLMQVGIGGSNWSMIPDTGSSDTWLMSSSYQCLDRSHTPQSQAYCNFGPSYQGGFSGGKIANQHMNITYGGGDSLNGDFGYAEYVAPMQIFYGVESWLTSTKRHCCRHHGPETADVSGDISEYTRQRVVLGNPWPGPPWTHNRLPGN